MKFGKVDFPQNIDFSFPKIPDSTITLLSRYKRDDKPEIRIGGTSWSRSNYSSFFPKGVKDELNFYSNQFNAIELNASFYRNFSKEQFQKWKVQSQDDFMFFPKLGQEISHWKRLNNTDEIVANYIENFLFLEEKLGSIFLQLPNNFSSKDIDRVNKFLLNWPKEIRLGIERRKEDWFNDFAIKNEFNSILKNHETTNIIVDTAGRRDVLHFDLTNDELFVRFVACNIYEIDTGRLNDWANRIYELTELGVRKISFFIHQDYKRGPILAHGLINKLNESLNMDITPPYETNNQGLLF